MCERYCDNSCAAKVEILNDFIDEFGDVLERKVLLSNFPDEHAKMDKLSILFMNFKCQFNKIFDFKESSDSINDNKPSSNISNVTCNANQNNLLTEEMLDELKSMNRSINKCVNLLEDFNNRQSTDEHAKSSNRDTIKNVCSSSNGKLLFSKEGFDLILEGLIRASGAMNSKLDN